MEIFQKSLNVQNNFCGEVNDMQLIYGTYNKAKFDSMVEMLEGLSIELLPLSSIEGCLIEPQENGDNPISNAEQKAMSYYKQIKRPVFSCDSGLFFKEAEDWEQPGVKIRRVNGKRLNDIDMMNHYMALSNKYGGKLTAYYKNAICLVIDENNMISYDGADLNSEELYIVNHPHKKIREGFPLDSISMQIKSGRYYYDLDSTESKNIGVIRGFKNFFMRCFSM